jgi:hypothetical protein
MKKIYAILLTSFLSFPIFANNQIENQKLTFGEVYRVGVEAVSTVYQDSKDVINNIAPEVKQALIDIAKALGVAVEHVYIVLVKKFVVDGVVQLIPFVLGIFLFVFGLIKFDKFVKNNKGITWHILFPTSLIIGGIITMVSVDYQTMLLGLINPEFGAINYIVEYSKSLIK